jgi:outer membrane protein assembly factor BamB
MNVAVKSCPTCGQASPATSGFCPNCGVSIADVVPAVKPASAAKAFFAIPASLAQTQKKRRRPVEDGGGAGLVWVGFILIGIPILVSHASWLASATWVAGLLVVVGGFWRMRHDRHAFARAGAATSLLAVAVLGTVALQLESTRRPAGDAGSAALVATAEATATPDWLAATKAATTPNAAFSGSVPMFRALPAHTGEYPGPGPVGNPYRKWRFDTGGEVRSSPAVAGGLVFFGSKDGYLYAVDVESGRERWRFDLGGYPVRSSPAVANRTVFVGGGYTLYAIDADTGEERWHFAMRYAGESSPTVADGLVFLASKESQVYAIEADSGTEKWHFTTEGLIFSSPAVADGVVYIGSDDGNLYAVDEKTGQSRWKFAAGGEVYSSPAVVGDRVYVTSKSRSTFAVDTKTGKEVWHYPVGGESSPAVVDGEVFVGADDGGLYALDAATGAPKWLFPTGRSVTTSPAISGGIVYVASGLTLYAVDALSGQETWHYPAGDEIDTSPTVVDGIVYVGAEDGYLYAVAGDGTATPTGK